MRLLRWLLPADTVLRARRLLGTGAGLMVLAALIVIGTLFTWALFGIRGEFGAAFGVTAGVSCLTGIIFVCFGAGETDKLKGDNKDKLWDWDYPPAPDVDPAKPWEDA